ncbi:hypothetical protein N5A92_08965 [Chelativorans sp. EGI FJ00035]|uniref:Uncharacterized protein n=2 Tax=Chelativorans salis TaxID=2978478 RepID=A0ABT2LMU2_9HYPH|nr:hypothetical protein [Chelativorans sp. EGI FJ00035]
MDMNLFGGKKGIAVLAGLLAYLALVAAAQAQRADVRGFTCKEARAMLVEKRAAVLSTGPNTYDRFVIHEHYCPIGLTTKPAWVQTSDKQACKIGYTCVVDTDDDDRWWWLRRR